MAENREVVITGAGIVSPIGIGREAFNSSLQGKVSGVARLVHHAADALPVPFGAELKDFQPKHFVKPRKSLKVMSREIQAGVASASLAVEDADLAVDQLDPERLGVVYGSPMLYSDAVDLQDVYRNSTADGEFDLAKYSEHFPRQMQPLWMLKYLPNMTASHIGIAHNARGANNTIVLGDASSSLAMIEAATVIQRGVCDVMLTGGSGNRLSLTPVVYRGDSNLSHHDVPEKASRPFDAKRDGMVLGEAAATLVFEERGHAERRGATILGRVLSYSSTHAGSDVQQGMAYAIERSIAACLEKSPRRKVGQVNAHGLSDVHHDRWEAHAIAHILGGKVPVTAPKSYFGNVGAASAALELAASLCNPEVVLPTLNFAESEPDFHVSVACTPQDALDSTILKLNQAATGQAVALLIETQHGRQ